MGISMHKIGLGFLLLCSFPAWAQASDPSEGRNGDFGGKLLITADPEGFWTEWQKPENPTVATTSKVTLAHPVYAMIVFHDCAAAANGKCSVTARFEIRRPDGKLYDEPATAPAWSEAPAPSHNLLASLASIGFRLEPQDPLGRYQITVRLRDNVAGKSIILREQVTAEAEGAAPLPTS
jgi:hypothetical protein